MDIYTLVNIFELLLSKEHFNIKNGLATLKDDIYFF